MVNKTRQKIHIYCNGTCINHKINVHFCVMKGEICVNTCMCHVNIYNDLFFTTLPCWWYKFCLHILDKKLLVLLISHLPGSESMWSYMTLHSENSWHWQHIWFFVVLYKVLVSVNIFLELFVLAALFYWPLFLAYLKTLWWL